MLTDAGFKESGGTPFRVVFFKDDIPGLRPLPSSYPTINPPTNMLVYKGEVSPKTPAGMMTANPIAGASANNINTVVEDFGPLIYGQKLTLGPIKPINIGSLEAPSPVLVSVLELVDFCSMEIAQRLAFQSIPASEDVRYGKLPVGSEQTLSMLLPSLKEANFINAIPSITAATAWSEQWSKTPFQMVRLKTDWSIGGILQRGSKEDKGHQATLQWDLPLDIPCKIAPSSAANAGGAALKGPKSILVGTDGASTVSFVISNSMPKHKLPADTAMVAIMLGGQGFLPAVTKVTPINALDKSPYPEPAVSFGEFQRRQVMISVPEIDCAAVANGGQLTVDTSFNLGNQPHAILPGAVVEMRLAMYFQDAVVQVSPRQTIRLAPAWPPMSSSPPSINTLLFLCDGGYSRNDYGMLSTLAAYLSMAAVFLDYEHFATEASNNGQLPGNLWTAYHGKATIVWLPSSPSTELMVPVPELVQHVAAGGGLVYGTQAAIALASTDGSPSPLTRRMAVAPAIARPALWQAENGTLALPAPMAVTALPSKSLVALLLAILSSLPAERKIALLQSNLNHNRHILDMTLADNQLDYFEAVIDRGCCGWRGNNSDKTKIMPVRKTAMTTRDALLAMLRAEAQQDFDLFTRYQTMDRCLLLSAWHKAVDKDLPHLQGDVKGLFGRDLYAIISSLLDKKSSDRNSQKKWLAEQLKLKAAAQRAVNIGFDHQKDGLGLSARLETLDILSGVVNIRSKR